MAAARAILAGYITTCTRNTIMSKLKEAAGFSGLPSSSPASNPDMDSSTWNFGSGTGFSGTLGMDLALSGVVDDAIEVITDKLNVADA